MRAGVDAFFVTARIEAGEREALLFEKDFETRIRGDLV